MTTGANRCARCKAVGPCRCAGRIYHHVPDLRLSEPRFREEAISGEPIYAWSRHRIDCPSCTDPTCRIDHFRGNEYQIVIRDGATVYEAHGPVQVTDMERDGFVGLVAILRHCRHASMTWPFYGQGITGAGPCPWGEDGWFVPNSPADLTDRASS